jgi:Activator of Hsp90 ATPase homolog 1-like protein
VLDWAHVFPSELSAEGVSRCTYDIETVEGAVKLTITHEMDRPESTLIDAVANGWPHILASLKSLLETGKALEGTDKWPEGL